MLNLRKLAAEQAQLAKKVRIKNDFEEITFVGGVDHTYIEKDNTIISGIVVLDYQTKKIVDKAYAIQPCKMPYIPGFLAYREMPSAAEAYSKLDKKPDVMMIDGNGILHPRKFGIASHFGVLEDIPTIGVAKKLFIGEVREGKVYVGDELRGMEFTTKEKAKPLFISPGHRITLTKAMEIVRHFVQQPHKLPEPLHLAHRYVRKLKEEIEKEIIKKETAKDMSSDKKIKDDERTPASQGEQ